MTQETHIKNIRNTYKFVISACPEWEKGIELSNYVPVFESKHYDGFNHVVDRAATYVDATKYFCKSFGWRDVRADIYIQSPVSGAYTRIHMAHGKACTYNGCYSSESAINEHVLYALNTVPVPTKPENKG